MKTENIPKKEKEECTYPDREWIIFRFIIDPDSLSETEISEFSKHLKECDQCCEDIVIVSEAFDKIGKIVTENTEKDFYQNLALFRVRHSTIHPSEKSIKIKLLSSRYAFTPLGRIGRRSQPIDESPSFFVSPEGYAIRIISQPDSSTIKVSVAKMKNKVRDVEIVLIDMKGNEIQHKTISEEDAIRDVIFDVPDGESYIVIIEKDASF